MTKIQKLKTISLLVIFILFLAVVPVFSQEIKAGEQFSASVFLNSEQESINAVEGKIVFPADILDLKEIRDGNSIINFWVEEPKNSGNEIIFSGIIPGGYQETNGLIFSAIFEAKKDGASVIEVKDAKILLNDGKGTLTKTAQIFVSKNAIPKIEDRDSPEDFKPEIAQNIGMFNGQWFLVFATQDKNFGIDHYEVKENGNWIIAESPYVLKDQKLRSFIYVKAIDKLGNERIAVLRPKNFLTLYKNYLIWSIIILGIIILYIIRKILWRK